MADTETQEKQTRIQVEKAELPLQRNESVNAFLGELRNAVTKFLFEKLKIKIDRDKGLGGNVWTCDVFSDQVVSEVTTYEKNKPSTYRFFATPYSRASTGQITLGEPVEVERRVSYVPKVTVTKRGGDFWGGIL